MTAVDRAAGYTHRLALQQVEVSLTQVFTRPVQGRHFFEAVIRENLDLGRPDRVGLLFPLRLTRTTPPPAWGYRTRVITDGVEPSLHVEYKSSHVKQYFKEQRALADRDDDQQSEGLLGREGGAESDPPPGAGRSDEPQGPRSRAGQSAVRPDAGRRSIDSNSPPSRTGNGRPRSASAIRASWRSFKPSPAFSHLPRGFRNPRSASTRRRAPRAARMRPRR